VCFRSLATVRGQEGSIKCLGMLRYSAGAAQNSDYPDSLKIGWMDESTCYTTGVNACNPMAGLYVDNVSLAIIDGRPLGQMSAEIWNFWQTSFPWNEDVTPSFTAAFDTTGTLVKSGLDIAPREGVPDSYDVPGDSIVVAATGT